MEGPFFLAPTILDLMGLEPPSDCDGRSLAAAVRAGRKPEARPIFAQRRSFPDEHPSPHGVQRAVRTRRWKYIQRADAEDQLFDLRNDPQELRNRLAVEEAPAKPVEEAPAKPVEEAPAKRLAAGLEALYGDMPSPRGRPAIEPPVRRNLRALGYVE